MTPDEMEKAVRDSESSGTPLPDDVERQRQLAIDAASGGDAVARALICCKVVVNGKVEYHKLGKTECTTFPIYGTVVADSNCK